MNQIPNIEETHNTEVEEVVNKIQYEIQINSGWKEDEVGFAGFTSDGKELIAGILTKFLHHQLQKHREELEKARQDWLQEEIVKLKGMIHEINTEDEYAKYDGQNKAIQTIIDRYQAEVDQDKALQDKK